MKRLAYLMSRYGSPYPMRQPDSWRSNVWFATAVLGVAFLLVFLGGAAFAADTARTGTFIDTLADLYGQICGVLVAVVVLSERFARLIPNSTNSRLLKVLMVVTTVLGVKVPDKQ